MLLAHSNESLGSECSGEYIGRKGPTNKGSSSSSSSEHEIESARKTKRRQRKESPNNIKLSTNDKHLEKKRKKGEILKDSNLPVSFSSASSCEHAIVSVRKTKKRQRKEILKYSNLPAYKKKSKKKETKERQRGEIPNNSKISISEKHWTKKRKKGEIPKESNLPVSFSSASSSEHGIVSVRKTKKRQMKEILKDSSLPSSKKISKKKAVKKHRAPFMSQQ